MTERAQSATFAQLACELVASGKGFRFQARGRSMLPAIEDGDVLHVLPVGTARLNIGDIVLFLKNGAFKAHRIVGRNRGLFITRGDAGMEIDGMVRREEIIGRVAAKERGHSGQVRAYGRRDRVMFFITEAKRSAARRLRRWSGGILYASLALLMLAKPDALVRAQSLGGVALDNVNSQSFTVGGGGNTCTGSASPFTCQFTHTDNFGGANSNTLLVVGVSMNTKNNADSSVLGLTCNGIAMTIGPSFPTPPAALRAMIFYLKNPPLGACTLVATVNKTGGAGNPIGMVMAATSLYRVNTSAGIVGLNSSGTGTTASLTFNGASTPGTNDGLLDVLAVSSSNPPPTVTANTSATSPLVPEIQQWNTNSGTTGQDIEATGSSGGGTGAAVTLQETISVSSFWSLVAIDIPALNPTAARVNSFAANGSSAGVALSWKSGAELHNLGYNVYRDVGGAKTRLNPSLIAGSALLMRDELQQHGAKSYGWIDSSAASGAVYWLEDVDLDGTRTMHGPVSVDTAVAPVQAVASPAFSSFNRTRMQSSQLNNTAASPDTLSGAAHVLERVARGPASASAQNIGFSLAAGPAVKVLVDHEGWYRVSQPQLVAAGLRANANGNLLHLYAEGVEQPMRITGGNGFGPQSAIEFYGTAIDTPFSGQRAYWLVEQGRPGLRIPTASAAGTAGPQPEAFIETLELKPRTTYFAALLREDTDNFFGPLVTPVSDTETIDITNLVGGEGTLNIALQGITQGQQHDVTVVVNGATLGDVTFADQQEARGQFVIPAATLTNGTNTITLTAQQGSNDLSLVDTITLSFPHTYTAESDLLKFTADAGQSVAIGGFSLRPSRLVDITDPLCPVQIGFSSTLQGGSYTLRSAVPWTTAGQHTLLALSDAQLAKPANIVAHTPSRLHMAQPGAEVLIVTAPQFTAQMQPLAVMHIAEGKSTAVVTVDQIYDEFNFGEPSPFAVKTFLKTANAAWKSKPHYLVLAGDASVDPRNYLGFGFFDFVPTRVIPTAELKTASDDWFSDFNNTGMATLATGRLPARTVSDAQLMVSKIVGYTTGAPGGWNRQALLVADVDDPGVSFTTATQSVQKLLPSTLAATNVFAGALGTSTARQNLIDGINNGQLLVNYNGHGSVQVWSGSNLFDDTAAASLTNGNKLPLFVIMNCLNGFFHDVYTQSLAESLMLSPNGGAVAVWASSGLTDAAPQFQMNGRLMQTLFSQSAPALGDAVLTAKSGISDIDVKRTFILFGDPAMRLQAPGTNIVQPFKQREWPGLRTPESRATR